MLDIFTQTIYIKYSAINRSRNSHLVSWESVFELLDDCDVVSGDENPPGQGGAAL